ncbi:MAG TPA: L-threonylcarbamoyladenylate synthase [Bacillota bacterium]|nr:L-threonylcarbamoyladenylate synthase [Bacillota bacterium]
MNQTKHWQMIHKNKAQNEQAISEAAQLLQAGELVAFPTETVYGLGADATNERAVAKIFTAKGRPQDNPLIVHVANKAQLIPLVQELTPLAEQLIDVFSPGPITYILPSSGQCAKNVSAGLATIAVRIPEHPIALQLLEASGIPLAAPSANISGKPSPTTADHVSVDLSGKIAGIIDGGPTNVGMESTVIDLTKAQPIILRPGAITKEMIEDYLHIRISLAIEPTKDKQPLSPGMKYPHYAPEVPLVLGPRSATDMQYLINRYEQQGKRVGVIARDQLLNKVTIEQKVSLGKTLENVGQKLFEALRFFKQTDVDLIICETFPETGLGQAIMNRLYKAATTLNMSVKSSKHS